MGRGRVTRGAVTHRPTAKTPADKAQVIIGRDLCILTGPELVQKYKEGTSARQVFENLLDKTVEEVAASHNPFYFYARSCWFDTPEGSALLCAPHRTAADAYLRFALGELDSFDGFHLQFPRRGLKSTIKMAFADWIGKRHKLVDGLDVSILYSHNSEREASRRVGVIKAKNRAHPYILRHFPEFVIPEGEWGTQSEWNWPCRSAIATQAEASITAMSAAAKKAGRGYNYKLLDDWEDEDSRTSDVIREALSFNYDQLRALKAVPFSRECVSGTPYHIHGLYKAMREEKRSDGTPRYYSLIIPALTDANIPNFPTIPALTVESLAKERANEISRTGNDAFWYMQYQLETRLTGTQTMEWDWVQEISVSDWRRKYSRLPHFTCVFIDSAWKGAENQGKGDDTAIGVIGIWQMGSQKTHILLELVVSNEMTSDEGATEITRLLKKWGTPYYAIEQQGEKTFWGMMKQVARSQYVYPVEIDLKGWTKKKKGARIGFFAGAARLGNFYRISGLSHLEKFRQQVSDSPQLKHDDILDMIGNSYAELILNNWVPVAVDEFIPKNLLQPDRYESRPSATRYTGVPLLN